MHRIVLTYTNAERERERSWHMLPGATGTLFHSTVARHSLASHQGCCWDFRPAPVSSRHVQLSPPEAVALPRPACQPWIASSPSFAKERETCKAGGKVTLPHNGSPKPHTPPHKETHTVTAGQATNCSFSLLPPDFFFSLGGFSKSKAHLGPPSQLPITLMPAFPPLPWLAGELEFLIS